MPLQPTNDPQGPVAVYLLERGIPFRLVRHTKTVRTKDLPQVRSVALEQVLKNLLFIDSAGEPLLCILGCDREIDTSKLRDLVGREVRLAEADEVLRHTASPIGNVPSVVPGLRKFLDATVTELELVSICSCLDNDAGIESSAWGSSSELLTTVRWSAFRLPFDRGFLRIRYRDSREISSHQ